MYEIERKRKFPAAHSKKLAARLKDMGYILDDPTTEVDTYFSRNDVDYMKTIECLRVRRRDDFAEITYKPPTTKHTSHAGITSKEELNVILATQDDATTALALLDTIGMVRLAEVVKIRRTFRHPTHPGVSISIDEIKGVGTFLEVEVMGQDKAESHRVLAEIEEDTGVASYEIATKPYRDLVMGL